MSAPLLKQRRKGEEGEKAERKKKREALLAGDTSEKKLARLSESEAHDHMVLMDRELQRIEQNLKNKYRKWAQSSRTHRTLDDEAICARAESMMRTELARKARMREVFEQAHKIIKSGFIVKHTNAVRFCCCSCGRVSSHFLSASPYRCLSVCLSLSQCFSPPPASHLLHTLLMSLLSCSPSPFVPSFHSQIDLDNDVQMPLEQRLFRFQNEMGGQSDFDVIKCVKQLRSKGGIDSIVRPMSSSVKETKEHHSTKSLFSSHSSLLEQGGEQNVAVERSRKAAKRRWQFLKVSRPRIMKKGMYAVLHWRFAFLLSFSLLLSCSPSLFSTLSFFHAPLSPFRFSLLFRPLCSLPHPTYRSLTPALHYQLTKYRKAPFRLKLVQQWPRR